MVSSVFAHIIDDDPGVRGTVTALCRTIGIEVLEYGDIAEFDRHRSLSQSGCVLLDLRLPRLGGLPGLQHVLDNHPNLPVIVISAYADVRTVALAMRAGATDFFQKPFDAQELLDSIQSAIAAAATNLAGDETAIRIELLSRQQTEVVRRLALGLSEPEIAMELNLHIKSVQRHRKNAAAKLHIQVGDEISLGHHFA